VIIHGSCPVSGLPPDEVAALRAANALLREVIEARTPRALRRRPGRKPGWPKGQPGCDAGDD
jgi:hypothetical protein